MPSDQLLDPNLLAVVASQSHGVLATIKRDGRPQLSSIGYHADPGTGLIRVSLTATRAKTKNLQRDPRCALHVTGANLWVYAVVDCDAELTPVTTDPHDATAEALVDLYRAIGGEHPDWDEYRAAMIAEQRFVLRLTPTHAYGIAAR